MTNNPPFSLVNEYLVKQNQKVAYPYPPAPPIPLSPLSAPYPPLLPALSPDTLEYKKHTL